jgi:probable H4MPT-linked C1 transfer pathway protein
MRDRLPHCIVGWDIGGAHLKAALLQEGRLRDVAQWPCELWRGVPQLERAFAAVFRRWPECGDAAHAVTMTGEMADVFENREAGVASIVAHVTRRLGERSAFYVGGEDFVTATDAYMHWRAIASANWLATATVVARCVPDALVVDVGSTTTDLVPIVGGRVAAQGRDDATRLACGELVYVGLVRTPLCALARTIRFGQREFNVMNELFATTADVFRLTGDLRAEHDQAAPADQMGKDAAATRRRLARMIGLDARDAGDDDWLAFARSWRAAVIEEIRASFDRVRTAARMPVRATAAGAGCGSALAKELAFTAGLRYVGFDEIVAADAHCRDWARTCAPSVAVAMLRARAP